METPSDRRRRLYGPARNLLVQDIRHRLSKSSVLKDGEYNYTNSKLSEDVFDTSYYRDFPGASLDPTSLQEQKGQLGHHFILGNDSGAQIPTETYRQSTTKSDFQEQPHSKPKTLQDPGIINWPDMAPRYMVSRKVEDSEYKSSYVPELARAKSEPPTYPRVRTSVMKLPLDPERFWRQRNTNIMFGSDKPQIFSEHQRVYGIGRDGPPDVFMRNTEEFGKDLSKGMKDLERTSHVFRYGDYNGIVGSMQTTVNDEFGPRTLPPAEHAARVLKEKKGTKGEFDDSGPENSSSSISLKSDQMPTNQLASYARNVTVPEVFKDADDGKNYQTSAHFELGYDPKTKHTIYAKDFGPGAMAARAPPQKCIVPNAGQLLQNDPAYAGKSSTSNQIDFSYTPALPHTNEKGQTQMEVNIERRHTDNIIMSFDQSRHAQDRQRSLAHSDYLGPPLGYKPMEPMKRPTVTFDYLTPNDALPYPAPANQTSEAKNNYVGPFVPGTNTVIRHSKDAQCKKRREDGRSTHFIVGYNPDEYVTETQMKFMGEKKNDEHIPFAGKTENVAPVKFKHIDSSANTQDLRAADPYAVSKQESLMARAAHRKPKEENPFTTSVMKADYNSMGDRPITDAQLRMIGDTEKKMRKDIAESHLFHMDNSGRNNFVTTAMDDFIKPETMSGRKFLAAR